MSKILSDKEIKNAIREEQKNDNSYQDKFDVTVDEIVSLYENKAIDERTLNTLLTFFIKKEINQNFKNLNKDLIKFNSLKRNSPENKFLLLNYSKKTYA